MDLKQFDGLKMPRTYIMGLRDKALPPDLTRGFADRLGVTPVEIDAGHDMMVMKPQEVAEELLRIP
jgi:pimeloyl-ACP methyl ester carboxylesterase